MPKFFHSSRTKQRHAAGPRGFVRDSFLATGILVMVIIGLGFALVKMRLQREEVTASVNDLERKISETKRNNEYLAKLADYFQSPVFLEKQARAKLNYKFADEEVTFVYRDTAPKKVEPNKPDLINSLPNYKKWFYYLRGVGI